MKRFVMMLLVLGLVASSVTTAEAARKTKKPTRIERNKIGAPWRHGGRVRFPSASATRWRWGSASRLTR
jgi:hypothetical protein